MPFFVLLCCFLFSSLLSPASAVWPQPQEVVNEAGHLRLASSFSITASSQLDALPDLHAAIERASASVRQEKHQRVIVERGESDRAAALEAPTLDSLELSVNSDCDALELGDISDDAVKPLEDRDEAYILKVQEGEASLTSCTAIGLFRGLSTFVQLVYALPLSDGQQVKYIVDAPLTIRVCIHLHLEFLSNTIPGLGCISMARHPTRHFSKLLPSRFPQINARCRQYFQIQPVPLAHYRFACLASEDRALPRIASFSLLRERLS